MDGFWSGKCTVSQVSLGLFVWDKMRVGRSKKANRWIDQAVGIIFGPLGVVRKKGTYLVREAVRLELSLRTCLIISRVSHQDTSV